MTEQTTLLENDIARLSENIAEQYAIDAHYFEDQSIKRGLRNADGTGVLIGVSKVGSVQGYYMMAAMHVGICLLLGVLVWLFLKGTKKLREKTAVR